MCGIVGMAGNLNQSHVKMFRQMLLFDTVRGEDSTGVCWVPMTKGATPIVEKDVGLPDSLFIDPQSRIFNSKNNTAKVLPKAAIGHNRAATVGLVTIENAHPFVVEDVVGVHNGSLRDWSDLKNYMKNSVDSKSLIENIEEFGIEKTWESFSGPAAVVWWDNKDDSINFARNKDRPLVYAKSKNKQAIFWASEEWMFMVAAARCKVDLETNENGKVCIYNVPENEAVKYKVTPTSVTFESRVKLTQKVTASPGYGVGDYDRYYPGMGMGYQEERNRVAAATKKHNDKVFAESRHGKVIQHPASHNLSLKPLKFDFNWQKGLAKSPGWTRRGILKSPTMCHDTFQQGGKSYRIPFVRFKVHGLNNTNKDVFVHAHVVSENQYNLWRSRVVFADKWEFVLAGRPKRYSETASMILLKTEISNIRVSRKPEEAKVIKPELAPEPKLLKGFLGAYLDREDAKALLDEKNCAWCDMGHTIDDWDKITMIAENDYCCNECLELDEVKDIINYPTYAFV